MSSVEGGESGVGTTESETESGSQTANRDEIISKYIYQAKKRREQSVSSARRDSKKPKLDQHSQWMIAVGQMYHCNRRNRGVLIKTAPAKNVLFRRNCTYERLLSKAVAEVIAPPTDEEGVEYYMADSKGICIYNGNKIILDNGEEGNETEESIDWTLENYIRLSNVRYRSKTRLYVVKKEEIQELPDDNVSSKPEDESSEEESLTGEEPLGAIESDTHVQVFEEPLGAIESDVQVFEGTSQLDKRVSKEVQSTSTNSELQQTHDIPSASDGCSSLYDFEPLFSRATKSLYRESYSVLSNVTQISAFDCLPRGDDEDDDILRTVEIEYGECVEPYLIHLNPCHFDWVFTGITKGDGDVMVACLCTDGSVKMQEVVQGSNFDVWKGGVSYPAEKHVALLACVAINGYHSIAQYQWSFNGYAVLGEIYPVLYTSTAGKYACTITLTEGQTFQFRFSVQDNQSQFLVTTDSEVYSQEDAGQSLQETNVETNVQQVTIAQEANITVVDEITAIKHCIESPFQKQCSQDLMLLEMIGGGTFGKIHKAIWRGTIVAAKVLPIRGNEKIVKNELEVYKSLVHPNVLSLLGVLTGKCSVTLIVNLVDGNDLDTILFGEDKMKLTFEQKTQIAFQICQALVFMHTCEPPVVHLDLKPENIMIKDGCLHVYIADFGLGKVLHSMQQFGRTTMKAGTPAFQSPEQIKGEEIGTVCDVYATGCIFFELYGEVRIWQGLSDHTIMFKVAVEGKFPSLEHITHDQVKQLLSLCFKPSKERACATDLLQILCDVAKSTP